jgi:hypothetical protein
MLLPQCLDSTQALGQYWTQEANREAANREGRSTDYAVVATVRVRL